MADEFFDDERELMEEAERPSAAPEPARAKKSRAAKKRGSKAAASEKVPDDASKPAESAARTDAPPFWMVLLIAVIALALGVVIGYLMGSASALNALEAQQEQYTQSATTDDESYGLPEGHPDVTVDEDGTAHIAEDGSDADSDGASDDAVTDDAAAAADTTSNAA